ncbi:MAG TPA: riboflavin synthase [Candidatus Mcinerneyibacterium sp.]|nr:riboflavin synthase [Candidatus Mcinerneyibacterium sp.]
MFTGLIEKVGVLKSRNFTGNKFVIGIKIDGLEDVKIGDSIACNGLCLTVIKKDNNLYFFELMKETLDKSYFDKLKIGSLINIEQALKFGGRMDGHFVQGHVDDVGRIKKIIKNSKNIRMFFSFNKKYDKYLVSKGSISIDGISLTIVDVENYNFNVGIISHTFHNTNLKEKNIGDPVNLEFDILSKYLYKFYSGDKKRKSVKEVLKKW